MPHTSRVSLRFLTQRLNLFLPFCLLTVWSICSCVNAVQVRAEGREDSVVFEHRDYSMTMLPTGDVSVIEHWQIHFTGGPFDTARLDSHLAHTAGIDFGPIVGAIPGTQHVKDGRDNRGRPLRSVEWNYPSTLYATRTFDIPYTIHSALGIGANQAWLDWKFLASTGQENFGTPIGPIEGYEVDESTVTITLPAATRVSDLSVKATDPTTAPDIHIVDATMIQVRVQHVQEKNPFEIVAAFPRSEINVSVQRQPWQTTTTPPTPPTTDAADTTLPQRYVADPIYHRWPLQLFLVGCVLILGVIALIVLAIRAIWPDWRGWQRTGK